MIAPNRPEPNGSLPLDQLFADHYRPRRLIDGSPATVHAYAVLCRNLARFLGRRATVDDLVEDTAVRFASDRVGKVSPATVNREVAKLAALWRFVSSRRWNYSDGSPILPPEIKPLREPARMPKAWTAADITRLFAACEAAEGFVGSVPAGLWWTALHSTIWNTAERISAVLAIRWDWLDLESGWLTIPAEARKGRTADKSWQLHPIAVQHLRAIQEPTRALVFERPGSRSNIYLEYNRLLKSAGLPTDRGSKFHRMRRSVASWFEASGGNATALLGHSGRQVTLGYLDQRIVPVVQASERLWQPGGAGVAARPITIASSATADVAAVARGDVPPSVESVVLPTKPARFGDPGYPRWRPRNPPVGTVRHFLLTLLAEPDGPKFTPRIVQQIHTVLNQLGNALAREPLLADLNAASVGQFLDVLRTKKLARSYIYLCGSHLRRLWGCAFQRGLLPTAPPPQRIGRPCRPAKGGAS